MFFGKLLGWTYSEIPGLGHSVEVGGCKIGGLFDLEGPNTPPGTKPHIGGLLKVENAEGRGGASLAIRASEPVNFKTE